MYTAMQPEQAQLCCVCLSVTGLLLHTQTAAHPACRPALGGAGQQAPADHRSAEPSSGGRAAGQLLLRRAGSSGGHWRVAGEC
jgi:hypothetical protein